MSDPIPRLLPKPGPKAIARLKVRILKDWRSRLAEIKEPKMKGRATRDFVRHYNSGLLLPEGFTEPKHISRSSLYGWQRLYNDKGLDGLIPKYKRGRKMADNLVPMLPTYKRIVIFANPDLRFKSRIFLPEIRRQWKWPPLHCPVMVVFYFYMSIPTGAPMRIRTRMLNHQLPHLKEPSLDKLVSFVKKCLREIVWEDDSQIIVLRAEKHFEWVQNDAKTEVFIRQLKG
jgi:Holliday junction resolvase RusA-like endonuclease